MKMVARWTMKPKPVADMITLDITGCWMNMLALSDSPKRRSEIWRSTKNVPKTVWRYHPSRPSSFLCLCKPNSFKDPLPRAALKWLSHCFPMTAPNAAKTLNARLA
jgi:hypothetical protein